MRIFDLAGAVACLTTLLLAACQVQPPATATPGPTAISSPSSQPTQPLEPTRAPTARTTATPTSTDTRPTEIPEPLPVALTLDEARSEVLGWLDPTRAPRIEGVKYLRRSALLHRLVDGYDENDPEGEWNVENRANVDAPRTRDVPPVLVGLVASTEGIDTLSAQLRLGDQEPEIGPCSSRAGQRESQFVALDAISGEPSVSFLLNDDTRDLAEWLAAQPDLDVAMVTRTPTTEPTAEPTVDLTAGTSLTPTATPLPTATIPPEAPRLTSRTLPPTLRATFDTYPLRPGSQWVWRTTSRHGGVSWSASVVTETIVAGWVVGPETVVVDAEISERHYLTAGSDSVARTLRRYVVPHGIFGESVTDSPCCERPDDGGKGFGSAVDSLGFALEVTLDPLSGRDEPYVFLDGEDVPVRARAGEFDGCLRISVVGGAGWGTLRWLCPGTGYVRSEKFACYGIIPRMVVVTELVRWTIPAW